MTDDRITAGGVYNGISLRNELFSEPTNTKNIVNSNKKSFVNQRNTEAGKWSGRWAGRAATAMCNRLCSMPRPPAGRAAGRPAPATAHLA